MLVGWIWRMRSMNTASQLGPHTRTEGRAPVWGSEFTTKAATPHGDSKELLPRKAGSQIAQISFKPSSDFRWTPPWGILNSKLRAQHRSTSLGSFVCVASDWCFNGYLRRGWHFFLCPDTDSFSFRCQNRDWRFPLAMRTATFGRVLVMLDHHPIMIGAEQERLVAALPMMTKSWGPSWGKPLPGERPRKTAET
jgi:hypothetical protein